MSFSPLQKPRISYKVKKIDKKSGTTYVYESGSYWDKEKKQPRSRRKLTGKTDEATGEIVPTRKKRKQISNQWQEVLDDMEKEHAGKTKKLNRLIAGLLDIVASLKKANAALDEKRKKHSAIITMLQQNWKMRRG